MNSNPIICENCGTHRDLPLEPCPHCNPAPEPPEAPTPLYRVIAIPGVPIAILRDSCAVATMVMADGHGPAMADAKDIVAKLNANAALRAGLAQVLSYLDNIRTEHVAAHGLPAEATWISAARVCCDKALLAPPEGGK